MKKTAIQRSVFLLLAAALLWGVWAWSRTPLDAGTVVLENLDTLSGETGGVDNGPYAQTYQYLLCFPEELPPASTAAFTSATHYVLMDDNTLTWADIWRSMISPHTKDHVRRNTVYSEYVWRAGMSP